MEGLTGCTASATGKAGNPWGQLPRRHTEPREVFIRFRSLKTARMLLKQTLNSWGGYRFIPHKSLRCDGTSYDLDGISALSLPV